MSTPLDAGVAPTVFTPSAKGTRIEAPHGGSIVDLAVTPDGTAALTIDDLGGVRLWPALDGSVEPRVVTEHVHGRQLALGPDPKGFELGIVDDAGGLVIETFDRDGQLVRRATLGIEPTYSGIAITPKGLLGWRADQRIVRLTAEGAITAQLSAEPGQRILGIGVAAATVDRAVAVIEGATPGSPGADDKSWKKARWLELGDKLAWGAWIEKAGTDVGVPIALAPSGKRFAYLAFGATPNLTKAIGVDPATGPIGAMTAGNATTIEMIDDTTAATAGPSIATTWVAFDNAPAKAIPARVFGFALLASGGGKAFTGNGSELAVATPLKTEFLGYALLGPAIAAPAPGGGLAIGTGDALALLDGQLRSRSLTGVVPDGESLTALVHLDGDDWLVQSSMPDSNGPITHTMITELGSRKRTDLRTDKDPLPALVGYDESSQLLSLSLSGTPELLRYARGKKPELLGSVAKPAPFDRVTLWPVSPAKSGGLAAVVAQQRDTLTLRWIKDPKTPAVGTTYALEGALAAVDVTGRAFVWQPDAKGTFELAMVRDGKKLGTLPLDDIAGAIWPDPTGDSLIATGGNAASGGAASGGKITRLGVDGVKKWSRPITGVTHVVWLDDGSIAVATAVGVMRLDGKTGEPVAMRCGWNFGLWPKAHGPMSHTEPLCSR